MKRISAMANVSWRKLQCSKSELQLDVTLACGQSFRWRETSKGEWTSALSGHVWTLKQDEDFIYYRIHEFPPTSDVSESREASLVKQCGDVKQTAQESRVIDISAQCDHSHDSSSPKHIEHEHILRDYFQLNISLCKLYEQWSENDPNFKSKAEKFPGVRILRQDPVENLFSFICSSNNHISRISGMVERLCIQYGNLIGELDGFAHHSFPGIDALADEEVEQTLRTLGFGYRAKYISQSARYIREHHNREWLIGLRDKSYEDAKAELVKLCGVGAKVADCVCLMSLDKTGAIPVDTHVWQIVTRDYKQAGIDSSKSVTNSVYNQIGEFFRELWGEYAGWAHSVLFSADLKKFKDESTSPQKRKKDVQVSKKSPKKKEKAC